MKPDVDWLLIGVAEADNAVDLSREVDAKVFG
jgi:hypothetical protein